MIISQEKSTLTSPPKKTKKSSKQKITPEVIEPKNQKGEKSEIIAGNTTTTSKVGSKRPDLHQLTGSEIEQKNENKSDGTIVQEKKDEKVVIEENKSPKKVPSTTESSTNKKLKLRRQKTEVVGPSPKKPDAEVDKPVPKPRGPSKVVNKPREESIGTDNEITKAKSDWDSEDDTKEPPLDHDEKTDSMHNQPTGNKRPDVVHQLTGSEDDEESESADEDDESDDEVEDEEESGKCTILNCKTLGNVFHLTFVSLIWILIYKM